jgi:hypothetical protein
MATYYYGRTGYIAKRMSIGGQDVDVTISRVLDWSIESSVDMIETTTYESNAATYVPGKQTATGSCSILYYRDNTAITQQNNNGDFTQLLDGIFKTTNSSTQDRFLLTLGFDNDPTKDRVRAYVYVTGAQITRSTTEMAQAQLQFTVDGHFVDVFDKTV